MRLRRALAAAALLSLVPLVPATTASAATVQVQAVDFTFQPDPVTIQPGDTISWTNGGAETHTVTADDGSFSGVINPGETFSHAFPGAGAVPYHCKIHGAPGEGMHGTVLVGAAAGPTVRLSGGDNIDAAIAWSKQNNADGGAPIALIGRDDVFADSLASGGPQGALNAPLLLTKPGSLDGRVAAELKRLGTKRAYLLGGTNALSPAVEQALNAAGVSTARVSGNDRVGTAAAIAEKFLPSAPAAVVARGFADGADQTRAFADSLSAGAFAAANGGPVLLSESGKLSDGTKDYIGSHPIHQVLLAGGEAALGPQVQKDLEDLGVEVQRVAGNDRVETSVLIASQTTQEEPTQVVAVDGANPNAWAAGFPAAQAKEPVALLLGDELPDFLASATIGLDPTHTQLVCAPFVSQAACQKVETSMSANDATQKSAALRGENEVPGPGEPKAQGIANIFPTDDPNALCFDYFAPALQGLTMAHIHKGAKDVAGPIVVPLGTTPGIDDDEMGCRFDLDGALVADIVANPGSYYVNLHSDQLPNGATRGQLFTPTSASTAFLLGEEEVPGPGDANTGGFGGVVFTGDPTELCAFTVFFPLDEGPPPVATAAHIHKGVKGQAGPVVVTLETPDPDTGFGVKCYTGLDQSLVSDIKANPSSYYVNIHTAAFPDGAVRGQLFS